jgi:hypothetical protein
MTNRTKDNQCYWDFLCASYHHWRVPEDLPDHCFEDSDCEYYVGAKDYLRGCREHLWGNTRKIGVGLK